MTQHTIPWRAYVILVCGLLAGSTAPIFIRYGENAGLPALVIVAGRLLLATLVMSPFVWTRYGTQLRRLSRRDILLTAAAGFWLGLHFIGLSSGLQETSILVSNVLGATSPLWTALLEMTALKSKPARAVWHGMGLTFIGVIIIALSIGSGDAHNTPLGVTVTLGGIFAGVGYTVIGRKARAHFSFVPYVYLVFGFAALTASILMLLTQTPALGYAPDAYVWIVMLTIFPQLMGHTSINYALRYFSATYIGLAMQATLVVSTFFAYVLFHEIPLPLQIVGGAAILAGVTLATLGQRQTPARAAPASEKAMPAPAGD
ncbi:MAG: DMT family transporter [Chloroflexi bacterium]|nr:DMT family transporter [Chloroflexota bacterium]